MGKPITLGQASQTVIGNVRRLRERRGLSLAQLSVAMKASGRAVQPSGLHRLENGLRRIDVDDLVALSKALAVPMDVLFSIHQPCRTCGDAPPPGFTCGTCDRKGQQK